MRNFLQRALENRGCTVQVAESAEAGARALAGDHIDAIVLDIALPGKAGIEWLKELRESGFSGDVILITAFADMETAIDALRAGPLTSSSSPSRGPDHQLPCNAASSARGSRARTMCCVARWRASDEIEGMIGDSPEILRVCALIKRVAPTLHGTDPGESGSAKEVAARALHQMSLRAGGPSCRSIARRSPPS